MSFQTQLEAINAARPASDAMTFDAFMALPIIERINLRDTYIFGHAPYEPVVPVITEDDPEYEFHCGEWNYEPVPFDEGPHW